ncbi:hypothetical protein [Legionella pneumophila]|uniref:hypothetical protein n=1 Tax=Legionella pneumophila TaxID=446 RepID=UPI00399CB71D
MAKIDSHFMKKNLENKIYPLYGGVSRLKNDSILNRTKCIIDTGCESNLTSLFLSENSSTSLNNDKNPMPGKGFKEWL